MLNLVTCAATVVILVALALPAKSVLERPGAKPADAEERIAPAEHPRRVFGAYVDPWHVDDWALAIGAAPQAIAKFEAFSRNRTLGEWATESRRRGIRRMLVSWEPWRPVPVALGLRAQVQPQAGYRNIDIANGAQDGYIERFARSVAAFPGTVYLRYAHEMNGYWYPWSYDARNYRLAWRRIVRLFDAAGADNVRFVWSVNPNLYEPAGTWMRNLRLYWPGSKYVDYVGKPLMLTETNTEWRGRVDWLRALRAMLRRMPWIRVVMWSQLPSRGNAHRGGDGIVDWDVQRDPRSADELRGIIRDGAP